MTPILLASQSAARIALLDSAGIAFTAVDEAAIEAYIKRYAVS